MIRLCIGLLLIAYPFAVYFLHHEIPPIYLILGLGLLAVLRASLIPQLQPKFKWMIAAAIGVFCAAAYLDDGLRTLKLYPVLVNLIFAGAFAFTLLRPPSAIQRISLSFGAEVPEPATSYAMRLTMVWIGFFLVSSVIAGYTALYGTTQIWTFYNGLLSYVLILLLLVCEYPIRLIYRKRHGLK